MSYYEYNAFVLPTMNFIGGEQQDLQFHFFNQTEDDPLLLTGRTASFSIQLYTNPSGAALITKTMTTVTESGEPVGFSVVLSAADTLSLCGKYIYQITLKTSENVPDLLAQGILYIQNNIHPIAPTT